MFYLVKSCSPWLCMCYCVYVYQGTACFSAGFCDVGLNLRSCYLKPTSATEGEFAQPKANSTLTTHGLHTHTASNAQKSHFGIQPKWPHVIFPFHSSDFSLSLSVHLSNTHEEQQHKRLRKRHYRPSCLVTVNPVNGTTVCFLSDSAHLIE